MGLSDLPRWWPTVLTGILQPAQSRATHSTSLEDFSCCHFRSSQESYRDSPTANSNKEDIDLHWLTLTENSVRGEHKHLAASGYKHTQSNSFIFCISSYLHISVSLALRHPLLTIPFSVPGKPTPQDTSLTAPSWLILFCHPKSKVQLAWSYTQPAALSLHRTEWNFLGQNHWQCKCWLSVFYGSGSSASKFRDTRLNKN